MRSLFPVGLATAFLAATPSYSVGVDLVGVRTSGQSISMLEAGDRVTFDLRFENLERESIVGLDVFASGFSSALSFVEGNAVPSVFNPFRIGDYAFGGLGWGGQPSLTQVPSYAPGGERLIVTVGKWTSYPSTTDGDGTLDSGINGSLISEGDVHARLVFEALEVAHKTTVEIRFGEEEGIVSGAFRADTFPTLLPDFRTASYALTVRPLSAIPEPGTALMIGLGLAGLASRRR